MDCLACGPTSSAVSREHVFAQWLLKEFGPDTSMALFGLRPDGTHEQRRAEIRLDSFRLKKICEACNTGWMCRLEEAAKPLILGLIRRTRSFASLSEEERRTLGKWAGKTAVVESHSIGAECPVSCEYLKRMRTNPDGAPGRFAVAASQMEMRGFGHMQTGVIRDLIGGGKASGNIIMIALPGLAFACAFPMLEIPYECRLVASLYAPLWPSPAAWYPMKHTPMPQGLHGMDELASMAERIELFHPVT